MKVFSAYRYAVLFPTLFVLLFSVLYSTVHVFQATGTLGVNDLLMLLVPSLIFCAIMAVLSLPILFNKINGVRRSIALSTVAWFPFPFMYLIVVYLHDTTIRIRYDFGLGADFIYLVFMTLPFVIASLLSFARFRRSMDADHAVQSRDGKSVPDARKINRRKFVQLSAVSAATASAGAVLLNSDWLFPSMVVLENGMIMVDQDVKQVFSDCGACSHTFCALFNREFGYPDPTLEAAADPLAGGLLNTQKQCGMLWGAALGVGMESYRRHTRPDEAIARAIAGTKLVIESFTDRTGSADCLDVVGIDMRKTPEVIGIMAKSMPGGFHNMICMNLAKKWYPDAIVSARQGLSAEHADVPLQATSCASEVARQMDLDDESAVMVAGYAGGIGLSGNTCGALGAAILLNTLAWCREHPGESGYLNPHSAEILSAFQAANGTETLCSALSGRHFNTIEEHTDFVNGGGCREIIQLLAYA